MASHNQMFRETHSHRHTGSGRRGRPGRSARGLMVLAVLAAVGIGAYFLMRGPDASNTATAEGNGDAMRQVSSEDGTRSDREPSSSAGGDGSSDRGATGGREVPLDVLEMGRGLAEAPDRASEGRDASSEEASNPGGQREAAKPAQGGAASEPDDGPALSSPTAVVRLIEQARAAGKQGDLLDARDRYNRALSHSGINEADAAWVREAMGRINADLVFSPRVVKGDPYSAVHVVKPGELISRFAPEYDVPWQLIARINEVDPRRVPAGARLKVVNGPFHVIVHKADYRADLYLGEAGPEMFVRSFEVGLGEYNSTPVGKFVVRDDSKLPNPHWTNPRTGEKFHADDPENPLGEFWIGVRGVDENTRNMTGYGLHGTIEPDTIGTQASMGCIRMLPEDIHLMFDCLVEGKSQVIIRP